MQNQNAEPVSVPAEHPISNTKSTVNSTSARGALKEFANVDLTQFEETAWKQNVQEKHDIMRLTAAVTKEEQWYVARCLEVEVTSQGQSMEEALSSLREALQLYFENDIPVEPLNSPSLPHWM